jgi:uncharacterized protein DUF6559
MITVLKRYLARRRLKPVVSTLPRRIVKAFGVGPHCTFLQARRAIVDLGLSRGQQPYAYAAVCRFEEFEKGNPSISAHDYRRLRTELADLFYLPSSDFTIRDLLRTPFSTGGEPFDSLGGGVNVPPTHGSGDGLGAG